MVSYISGKIITFVSFILGNMSQRYNFIAKYTRKRLSNQQIKKAIFAKTHKQ